MADRRRRAMLVTGAASGMGAAMVRRFARGGWWVGAFDVDERRIAALREHLGADAGLFG